MFGRRRLLALFPGAGLAALGATLPFAARAGAQQYEELALAVRNAMAAAVASSHEPPEPKFDSPLHRVDWLSFTAGKLVRHKPNRDVRLSFLLNVRYEAQRAGLDPELVLGLIQVESGFKRYAVSHAGAIGYMQVMPFWTRVLGNGDPQVLFDTRTNLRYGSVILRHYLDMERGNLFRALGRYNGSLGRAEYPNLVLAAWRQWQLPPRKPSAR
jgi:soluble lytic murein transglycosylase-like protein